MMQPGAMMQHGQPMPEMMKRCREMHSPADRQQHMMHQFHKSRRRTND